jgi:hypothetical protein
MVADVMTSTRRRGPSHANRPAGCLEDKTAFRAPPQAQIKLDPSVDVAATQGAPRTVHRR